MPLPNPKLKAAEAKKLEAERLQGFLQEMLREEENKYCADCEQKQPRWASWNLGVFLCIRCAGLHRNLGVHISKVKSVTLDSWTPEQVQSMRVMGNAKARAVYESELPSLFRRPQTDQSLEQFIRAKYEAKRYIMKGWVPPRVDVADLPAFPESMARDKKAAAMIASKGVVPNVSSEFATDKSANPQSSPPIAEKKNAIPQLIDFDFASPTQNAERNTATEKETSSMDDIFGPIVSAAPPQQQLGQSLSHTPFGFPASVSSPNLSNSANTMLNDIFSTVPEAQQQTRFQTTGLSATTNVHSNSDFLANFPSAPVAASQPVAHQPQQQTTAMHSNLIGSDLQGLDLNFDMLNVGNGSQGGTHQQQAPTMLASPPAASDTKKSTNEILALFNK